MEVLIVIAAIAFVVWLVSKLKSSPTSTSQRPTLPAPSQRWLISHDTIAPQRNQAGVVVWQGDAKSNAGVFVRITDGILEQVSRPGAAFDRGAAGKISERSMKRMMASAEREEGPWFAVHRGYEVQIMDANDSLHRTGAIYSLAPSAAISPKAPGEWKTTLITLSGDRILVDLDGQRITSFDPESPDVPRQRQWFEPKREPKRPLRGYLGLQNHDPGDVVWFKEIRVRPLIQADTPGAAGVIPATKAFGAQAAGGHGGNDASKK
ncbi:MAG: DUF1080 domain-containing protein [Verrucomicrobia bacterium]|nr:DUF1080 domain-containing protein [Verrucomicrobiota bacterium]